MATPMNQANRELIQLGGNTASPEEIKLVWKSISSNRTIRVRQIAAEMKTSAARVQKMINFLKAKGYIANDSRNAWDVIISYTEIYQ